MSAGASAMLLNPGFFMAQNDKGHFEVQAVSDKGKEEWIKFNIVQHNAISRPETQTRTVADNSSTSGQSTAETAPSVPAAPTIQPPPSAASGYNMGFPSKWKSMSSGTTRTLRFETLAVKAGAFTLLEFKKDGDKFVGKANVKLICPDGGANCPAQFQIELILVTPERIEGRTLTPPSNAKIDWSKCSFSLGPDWQDFTWILVK